MGMCYPGITVHQSEEGENTSTHLIGGHGHHELQIVNNNMLHVVLIYRVIHCLDNLQIINVNQGCVKRVRKLKIQRIAVS